jgi:hypothetical protein
MTPAMKSQENTDFLQLNHPIAKIAYTLALAATILNVETT